MSGDGVSEGMPVPWPADGELPPPGDAAFDALLDRAPLPGDAAASLHQLAAAFGELHEAPVWNEPAAEQRAIAAFRAAAGQPAPARPSPSQPAATRPLPSQPAPSQRAPSRPAPSGPGRRRAQRPQDSAQRPRAGGRRPRVSARIAAISAAVVVSLGGAAAAAAYTGALPGMLHRLTHHQPATPAVTAPQPTARPAIQPTTETRSAAPGPGHGLCIAYQRALAARSASQQAWALGKLIAAAGGRENVAAYCAGVVQPKPTPGARQTHPTHPAHPTHRPHPTHPPHPAHPPHPSHGANAG